MPIDPTIPLGIQQQPSPLASLQQPIQTAQGLLALKQNQMQLGANQAISQAYQQSVNPDGTVDFNKLQSLAAQNGAGAFLPQFMGQIAQQRNSQLQYDTGKLDLALKQQQGIRGMIGSLAVDPNVGKADMSSKIAGQISNAVQSGILPLDQGLREIQSIPGDPKSQAAWIQNHLINSLSGEAKIQALMPKVQTVDSGGQINLVPLNPLTGQVGAPVTTISKTLTPGEAAQNVDVVDPQTGAHYAITKAQQLAGGGAGAPAGAAQGYTGRYPQGSVPGGLQTSLGPGQQSALAAQAGTSNTAAQTLHDAAADAPMRINLLETARDALNGALDKDGNPLDTGPGADWRNQAKSFINSLAPGLAQKLGWTGNVQNYDEFKKILTNYASSVSGSLGTGTDARLNAAVTGNANPGISKLANEDILTKTIAAEKMRAAQDYAFQNSGLTTDKFNQWQSQWNKSVNPDAFAFASMNPEQQQKFLSRQSPAQLTKFKADLGNLVRAGLLQPPAAQSAPPSADAAPLPASGVPQ